MSAVHGHINYALATALNTALGSTITVSGTTYQYYNSVPVDAPNTYVRMGEIIDRDNGTKEAFIYEGTVPIIVNDESSNVADRKLAYSIMAKVRSILKGSKTAVLSLSGYTMTVFAFDTSLETISYNDEGRVQIQLIDIYRFIIE